MNPWYREWGTVTTPTVCSTDTVAIRDVQSTLCHLRFSLTDKG